jgi:hypothetical protein
MRKLAGVTATVLAATVLLALIPAGTARAQGTSATSYVASNGSDGNSCVRASPCFSFTKAISATNPGGEIRCVDQLGIAGFPGTVTITQSITIDCKGIGGAVQRVNIPPTTSVSSSTERASM